MDGVPDVQADRDLQPCERCVFGWADDSMSSDMWSLAIFALPGIAWAMGVRVLFDARDAFQTFRDAGTVVR